VLYGVCVVVISKWTKTNVKRRVAIKFCFKAGGWKAKSVTIETLNVADGESEMFRAGIIGFSFKFGKFARTTEKLRFQKPKVKTVSIVLVFFLTPKESCAENLFPSEIQLIGERSIKVFLAAFIKMISRVTPNLWIDGRFFLLRNNAPHQFRDD